MKYNQLMGKNYIYLVMLLISSFSFGQKTLGIDQGVSLIYQGANYVRTVKANQMYDPGRCVGEFLDVYRVSAILINNSNKKVKDYSASVNFKGKACLSYQGGQTGIGSQDYSISFSSVSKQKRNVDGCQVVLMPGDQAVEYGEVYVGKGESCPQPGGNFNLSFCGDAPKLAEPEPTPSQTVSKSKPQWSGWQTFSGTDCNPNIEFQILKEGGYVGLQYQLWLHYKVKNNNDKTVTLQFSCLDANGKVHFGNTHKINPGQIIEDKHKMDADKIKFYRPYNLVFTSTGKPVCGAAEEENMTNLVNKKNQLCMELGNLIGNTVNYVYKNNCQQVTYTVKDLNRIQNEINQLEQELNQVKAASSKRKIEDEKNTQELNELINEINELCPQLLNLARSTQKVNEVAERDCVGKEYTKDDLWLLKGRVSSVKNEISKLKNEKEEEERKRKEQEEKFNSLISQGDNSFSNKNYDNAMSYYSQAQNIAANDSQKQIASQKYNQAYEAKRTAARADRVAEARRIDKAEDEAYVAMAGTVITAMSFMKDKYMHRGFSGKFQTGLGYNETPMITNQNNGYAPAASYADKASYLNFDLGLKFEILNNKPVNINVRGLYSIGWHAFEKGVKGLHQVTGVDGGIQFWYKTNTKFKLFADFGWYQREGERTKDQDAVYDDGTSASDDVREGTYKYNVLRLGFGPMLHFRDSGRETWIKSGVYFDKTSFAKEDKPTILYSLNTNINSSIIIDITYSKNYPVAGTINYPTAFTFANQNYFSFKIIKQGKLW